MYWWAPADVLAKIQTRDRFRNEIEEKVRHFITFWHDHCLSMTSNAKRRMVQNKLCITDLDIVIIPLVLIQISLILFKSVNFFVKLKCCAQAIVGLVYLKYCNCFWSGHQTYHDELNKYVERYTIIVPKTAPHSRNKPEQFSFLLFKRPQRFGLPICAIR